MRNCYKLKNFYKVLPKNDTISNGKYYCEISSIQLTEKLHILIYTFTEKSNNFKHKSWRLNWMTVYINGCFTFLKESLLHCFYTYLHEEKSIISDFEKFTNTITVANRLTVYFKKSILSIKLYSGNNQLEILISIKSIV